MSRKHRMLTAGALFLLASATALAQAAGKLPVVVYVFASYKTADMAGPNPIGPHPRALVHRLRDLGWEDGRNFVLERHGPQDNRARAQAVYADAVARKVDVIIAVGTTAGTLTALDAVAVMRTIPIVFAGSADPVALGLVPNLARPGGNVTGLTVSVGQEILTKRLELLKEIAPRAKRFAYLNPKSSVDGMIGQSAAQMGIQLLVVNVESRDEYEQAFATLAREKVDAVLIGGASMHYARSAEIAAFATQRRLAVSGFFPELVEAGALMSYGIDFVDLNRRVAEYVDKILRGAKPGDLAVELPRKFELVVNLKTARALGITVPQSVLLRTDRAIE